jgi:DNA mismatch endonuclease (patch repair protein)
MRAIRNKDMQPEIRVRKALHALGFRYRLHERKLPGHPNIVLPKYWAVIFVHGCFWHGHDCHLFKILKTRTDFWVTKIDGNVRRDAIARQRLLNAGWPVAVVWGHLDKKRALEGTSLVFPLEQTILFQ